MPRLCVIPGDGIGREVTPVAVEILQKVMPDLDPVYAVAGWDCFCRQGESVPQSTLEMLKTCGAGLFGAVSSPTHKVEGYHSAILTMRRSLDLYANIRPVRSLPGVSPKPGVDMVVVRENSEGLYVGRERLSEGRAVAERVITEKASRRIARKALKLARAQGRKKLTIVHKANVLPLTDGLFRDCVRETAFLFPNIEIEELLVDVAALEMVGRPENFDTIVTTNLFGDILSDAAAYWGGGLGLAPSLNLGEGMALAEPVHGSAPDIAGFGVANPIAAILSAALLARFQWNRLREASLIEKAVETWLEEKDPNQQETTQTIKDGILNRLESENAVLA